MLLTNILMIDKECPLQNYEEVVYNMQLMDGK